MRLFIITSAISGTVSFRLGGVFIAEDASQ